MDAKYKRTFLIGIWALSLLSPVALAESAEEMLLRANKVYSDSDLLTAMDLLVQSSKLNYPPAQARLGEILDYTEQDTLAVGWFMMAASQGDAAGEFGLGSMYLTGEGMIKADPEKALYWIKRAAEQDYLNAVKVMVELSQEDPKSGLPQEVDPEQVKFWKAKQATLEAAEKKAAEEAKLAKEAAEKKAAEEAKLAKEAAEKTQQGPTK